MKSLCGISVISLSIAALVGIAVPAHAGDDACARKAFKTNYVGNACRQGGQKAAKKAMKKFLAKAKKIDARIKNCKSCHVSLSPSYRLQPNGLQMFQSAFSKVQNQL